MEQLVKSTNLVSIEKAKLMIQTVLAATIAGTITKKLNICLHGSPGLGKSAIIAQLAKEIGATLIDLRLSAMQESDVLGIPYTFNGEMKFSTPEWWPDGSVPTILFLDELKSAPPAVQTAAYRLILDRSIQNGKVLPDNCMIVAAGNMKEDKTGARELLPAAANRFGLHLIIDKKAASEPFLNYAMNNGFHRTVVGYLTWKKESVYGEIGDEAAFATPRTWEDVSSIMNTDLANDDITRNIAVAGAVGSMEAMSFAGYLENYGKLPDWTRIRSGDKTYKYSMPRGDMGLEYAVATGVAFELLDAFKEDGNNDEVSRLGSVVTDLSDDMKIVMFKTIKRDMRLGVKLFKCKELVAAYEVIRKYVA